jgi:hypothetical protein
MSAQYQIDSGALDADWIHGRAPSAASPVPGGPVLSALAGGVAGGLGTFLMLVVTRAVLQFGSWRLDLPALTDAAVFRVLPHARTPHAGYIGAVCIGVLLGATCGWITRHLRRLPARLLFFTFAMPALWLCIQAFVLRLAAPWAVQGLPFVAFAAGMVVYGWCLALMPPVGGARRARRRSPSQ